MDFNENILNGAKTAFINGDLESSSEFRPKLILNNEYHKVLNSIKDELHDCDEFIISVAFITMGGLTPLLQDLLELKEKGIKGKILTTDYRTFTEPEALEKLNSLENIEVRIYPEDKQGFHTKGYIFKKNNIYKGLIGSSNLTMNALTLNKEWNLGFSSLDEGEVLNDILEEFNNLWLDAYKLEDYLPFYKNIYDSYKHFENLKTPFNEWNQHKKDILSDFQKGSFNLESDESKDKLILSPNSMQEDFLTNIRQLIKNGENRALLISATGTGKTYASAFAVKDFHPKKFLFLVHREQIAKQSIEAYKNIFPDETDKFGLLSGNSKDFTKDYLFSTIQTMSKDDIYTSFKEDEFDYIIIDEVHKAGANSYIKVMNYFKPKFYLGMSASPDRTDDFNIYELFNHNIAHEIRLQEALEEDLLCPFHYFGIRDLEINGVIHEDSDFEYLTSNDRVNYLLEKSHYYGYSGDRIKALVFCSTKKEAHKLAKQFTSRGHPSVALTGDDSQEKRTSAIDRLTNDNNPDKIEYIFTVDIFNEGVDIPEINQVLLARPTQSSIIFIQQLGRGLRKFKNKEYVVIIDFIGNYKNNFLIPIALSGDKTFDKDTIRRYLMEANKIIPGSSSINFDEISKKRIYTAINNTNFSKVSIFKQKYQNLKFKLGKIPYLVDFYNSADLDPLLILNHSSFDCYHSFLQKADKEYTGELSPQETKSLKLISKVLANGKRPHEALILKFLIHKHFFTISDISKILEHDFNITNDHKSIISSIRLLNLDFFKSAEKAKYDGISYFTPTSTHTTSDNFSTDSYTISPQFKSFLSNPTFYNHINDLLDYILLKYTDNYNNPTDNTNLSLYQKYSRKDICRLLNWPEDDSSTIYGYRIKYNTCPIFVTYDKKSDEISKSTNYQDEFESKHIFSWMTRSNLKLTSKEVLNIINHKENHIKILLFIKKSDDEGSEFYFMGQVEPISQNQTTITNDKGKDLPIVNFKYKMHHPVKDELYNYFVSTIDDE